MILRVFINQISSKSYFYHSLKFRVNEKSFIRVVGPPSTWILSQTFQQANEESIYGRLYKNNMDGLNSFFQPKDALKLVIDKDSVAMFYDDPIYSFKEYHCKVNSIQSNLIWVPGRGIHKRPLIPE